MPSLNEADNFVNEGETTLAELRTACQIAGLDDSGDVAALRERLNRYLEGFTANDEIVCLRPEPKAGKSAEE
jgi:hypothetical protein